MAKPMQSMMMPVPMMATARAKAHPPFRGRRLPILLAGISFGFGALQLFLHPAHDASLWTFPTLPAPRLARVDRRHHDDDDRRPEDGAPRHGQDSDRAPRKQDVLHHRPNYHLVFSTSCGHQQDWESFVFFYHAHKVGQPGNVTRIASGCTVQEAKELYQFHTRFVATMNPNFHVHFTPGYGRIHELPRPDPDHPHKGPYKYMNKPFGLRHYMESPERLAMSVHQTSSPYDDDILLLLDPDMILLRPIVHDFTNAIKEPLLWVEGGGSLPSDRKRVRHGHPIAQQDPFLGNEWMNLPMPNFTKPPEKEGPVHWNAGPPYLATVKDMYQIVVRWTELAPKVLRMHDHLFAEMYGLIFATHQLAMPFTLVQSFVLSETASRFREGWEYIDQLNNEEICLPLSEVRKPLPLTLHYCERYMLGRFFFLKYRVKKNILRCDKPLFRQPPTDLFPKFNYTIEPPRADGEDRLNYTEVHTLVKGGSRQAKREAFMLCQLTRYMNEALRYFKSVSCLSQSANLNETYNVYDDPSDW